MFLLPPISTLFPYTTLFRSQKRVLKQLRQASTPKEANRIVVEQYLRPNREKANMTAREALTLEYAGAYRNPEAFE